MKIIVVPYDPNWPKKFADDRDSYQDGKDAFIKAVDVKAARCRN